MENGSYILKNKPIPKAAEPVIEKIRESGEEIEFVIVGDMSLTGKYAECALIFTKTSVTLHDPLIEGTRTYLFSDMSEVRSKRMYGNATISAVMPSGKREIFFRYTYSVATLCDSAALFISIQIERLLLP